MIRPLYVFCIKLVVTRGSDNYRPILYRKYYIFQIYKGEGLSLWEFNNRWRVFNEGCKIFGNHQRLKRPGLTRPILPKIIAKSDTNFL